MSRSHFLKLITLSVFLCATAAWSQDQPSSQDYMQSAQNALQDNDVPRAIEDYTLAIKIDPRNWQAYQNLGGCYIQLHRMDDAKAAYQQSLAINPNNADLVKFMAQIWSGSPTPTPTFVMAVPMLNTPTPTPTFVGILMNTPTPQITPTMTPTQVQVMVPFIELSAPTTLFNGQIQPTPTYFESFKPYQALARYNLPEKNTLTLEIGGAVWFGNAQGVNDYWPDLTTAATAPTAGEVDLGVDYALINEFQLGIHLEGLVSPGSQSALTNGQFVELDSYAIGAALSAKYLIPLNSAMSLIFHLEGGYYTLVASDIAYDDGQGGNIGLTGSAIGGLGEVQLELFQVEDKSMAIDLGLGYRMLSFNSINESGTEMISGTQTVISGPFKNPNGTPGYIDDSGPRISLSIRFIH